MALAANGREEEAAPILRRAFAADTAWIELLKRLPAAGLFPDDRELVTRMTLSGRQDVTELPAPAPPPGGGLT